MKKLTIITIYDYFSPPVFVGIRLYQFINFLSQYYHIIYIELRSNEEKKKIINVSKNLTVIKIPKFKININNKIIKLIIEVKVLLKTLVEIQKTKYSSEFYLSYQPQFFILIPLIILKKLYSKKKICCDITDINYENLTKFYIEFLLIKRCDCLLTISPFIKRYYDSIFEKPIEYIPHPVFEEMLAYSNNNFNDVKDGFIVGYAGTINKNQGIDFLIKSFYDFLCFLPLEKKEKITLLIVGNFPYDQPYSQHILEMINTLNINKSVVITGFIESRNKLWDMVMSFDVGIIPKQRNLFNEVCFPTKLIEYLVLKVPTICTSVGVPKLIINNNKNGWLVDPDEKDSLSQALLKIYNMKKETRLKIGLNGKNTIEKHFTFDLIAKKLLLFIRSQI